MIIYDKNKDNRDIFEKAINKICSTSPVIDIIQVINNPDKIEKVKINNTIKNCIEFASCYELNKFLNFGYNYRDKKAIYSEKLYESINYIVYDDNSYPFNYLALVVNDELFALTKLNRLLSN